MAAKKISTTNNSTFNDDDIIVTTRLSSINGNLTKGAQPHTASQNDVTSFKGIAEAP